MIQKSHTAAGKGALKPLVPNTIPRHGLADYEGMLGDNELQQILTEMRTKAKVIATGKDKKSTKV